MCNVLKNLTIQIMALPDNEGYEAKILGEPKYCGCGESEKEALERLGLVMFDVEGKKTCKNCRYWNREDEEWGRCPVIQVDPATCDDDYYKPEAMTPDDFWCCEFEERKGNKK